MIDSGARSTDLEKFVVSHGCRDAETNRMIYEAHYRRGPRFLFRAADRRYRLAKRRFSDVGCAYGVNLLFAGASGSYGIELDLECVEFARSVGLDVHHRDVVADDLSDLARVEAIWCCAVLEHVDAPHLFLRKLWTLLQPGGTLFLWVPTIPGLPWRLFRHVPPLSRYLAAHRHSDHVNAFTPATVRFTAERAGFDTVALDGLYPAPLVALGRKLFIRDGVLYVGRRREVPYFGHSTRKGRREYFDSI